MDFSDTPDEGKFREDVKAFLAANAERKSGATSTLPKLDVAGSVVRAKAWQAKKAQAGFACMTWPEPFGGRGLAPIFDVIYEQEEANYLVPTGVFEIGLGMCLPTLMKHGDPEVVQRYTRKALTGEEIWCQLFSEPASGSDLAGLRTRAVRDGDDWIINGQKVWTSGAHFADYGVLVTRSDPDAPKHKGLTYFFLHMKSPGVEIRPIHQISGAANFNEVYFTDVRIADSQRLGEVGQGWQVSLTTLMNERLAVGGSRAPDFDEVFELARNLELESGPAIADSAVRERLADWYVEQQGLKFTQFRTMTALSRGQTPGPEASIGKVVAARKMQEISLFALDLLDQAGASTDAELAPMEAAFQQGMMASPGLRIAGGTDEILRNIIAERVLGLPPDIRVDKELPFTDLPRGKF
ncbi:MAG: acyl-CoA dehydrogenase [Gammaproteobacteria bacterium]|nr:acyl-CoA dehydrogenase [Gammaproteobacteria bacterium]